VVVVVDKLVLSTWLVVSGLLDLLLGAGDLDRDLVVVVVVVEWEEEEEDLPRLYSDGWQSSLDPKQKQKKKYGRRMMRLIFVGR